MFLALTSDQRFWKSDEKILFLGEWCRLYRDKSVWSALDAEVLPYYWDDRVRFKKDYFYIDALYEKYLDQLSKKLNQLHGVDYSLRYWRIIVGPWLNLFMGIFYDRYLSIRQATNSGKVTQTWLPPLQAARHIPKDLPNFRQGLQGFINDDYNHYLYGRIIEALGEIPFETKIPKVPTRDKLLPSSPSSSGAEPAKRLVKKIIGTASRWIPSQINQVIFVSSYLNFKDLFRLQWALGQLPYLAPRTVVVKNISADLEMRKELKLSGEDVSFENLLREVIPEQIPTAYIESYPDMRQRAMAAFPRAPKVIYTTSTCWVNDGFNFWAAAQVEQGAKLVISQHGGVYGTAAWSATEAHETSVCDRFLSWGWENADQPKVVPFLSGQLYGLHEQIKPDPKGCILWIGNAVPIYTHCLVSVPLSSQLLNYFKEQKRFARAVGHEVYKLLVRRLFPVDFSWDEELRWVETDPALEIYRGDKTFYQQLNESRLCVGTCASTAPLEALAGNYPTIIYFNPNMNEFRESAQPYFDDLRRVGIYHETPESAATKVNEVYNDPLLWWNSAEVQDVRKKFCHRFARTSKNWISELKEECQKLIEE